MITELLTWYGRQLRALLPGTDAAAAPDGLIVAVAGPAQTAFQLLRRRNRAEAGLGRYAMDEAGYAAARAAIAAAGDARRQPVSLRVPAACLLERTVVLPLAAERDLDRALAYEMDRLTPFAADDVFWTHAVEHRDRVRERVTARLSLVPKATLETTLEALAGLGLRPARLEAAAPGGPRVIALVHEVARPRARALNRLGWAAAGALAVAVLALPFARQSVELSRVADREAALAPQVAVAEKLRARLGQESGAAALAAERAHAGNLLQTLASLTDTLPDDTYLTDLSLRQGKVSFGGESPAAAKLIPLLADNALLRNPSFVAPVTRSTDGQREHFSIRVDIGS